MPSLRTLADIALGYGAKTQDRSGSRFRQPSVTLAYGPHPLQMLDMHSAGDGERPVMVFVHGGAWQFGDKTRRNKDFKAPFCHGEGWHFAALNFRMVPEVNAGEMVRDIAAGLATIIAQASTLGVDRQRIIVMGHSSGAHLAALVASDPAYLGEHGLAPQHLAGLITNDGAALDTSLPSTGSRLLARRLIEPAFAGTQGDLLSPVAQIGRHGECPPCLILHAGRHHARAQAVALESALQAAGNQVERHGFAGTSAIAHMQLSRQFGRAGFGPTEIARNWLRERLKP